MARYYESYKILILATALSGVYFPIMDKIYEGRRSVKLLKFLSILPGFLMPVYFFALLKYHLFDEGEPSSKMYGLTLLIFCFMVNFTFFSFYYYRKDLARIFELWDSMFQEDLYSEERQELIDRNRKITNRLLISCTGLSIATCLVYFFGMFFNPSKKLNHPLGILNRPQSPDYELANLLDTIVVCFGLGSLLCYDTMTMTILSFEESQLKHLKRSLPKILDSIRVSDDGKILVRPEEIGDACLNGWEIQNALEQVDGKFKIWLSHHRQIIKFHKEFEKVFRTPISVKFGLFILMLCFVGFMLISGKLSILEIILSITFCFICFGVFYVNITYADSILELGDSIFGEAFEKSWYLYPKKFTDAFIIIILNSHRPVHYLAFRNYKLTSHNFLQVFTSAYSLLACLIQTSNRRG